MECIKTCPEIYRLSQQAAQTLKNQSGSTDLIICHYKQQLQLKDKMIELMANNIRRIQNSRCGKDEAETKIISYFKDKALAELEE